jgi:hypothetical protein
LNIIAACGVLISVGINFILVPKMQAVGSAYASLSAQFITSIAQLIVVVYLFKFRINYKYLLALIVFVSGVVVSGYFSRYLHFDWKINLLLMLTISTLLAMILRLISIRRFIQIIKSE